MAQLKYKRVLLKISGEALAGDKHHLKHKFLVPKSYLHRQTFSIYSKTIIQIHYRLKKTLCKPEKFQTAC